MTTLTSPSTSSVLNRLFAASDQHEAQSPSWPLAKPFAEASAQEKADALQDAYMPVSREGGQLLYLLARSARPQTVVEFGTSYGISTIHLAAALADNGSGHLWTSELSSAKVAAARDNLQEAGLASVVTVLEGDALQTLAEIPGPIGLLLLDGWKDLYLPVLHLLESRLAPGALVVADDTSFESVAEYLAYVREPDSGYVNVAFPVEDGMEISCRP